MVCAIDLLLYRHAILMMPGGRGGGMTMCFAESLFLCHWEEEKLIKCKDVYKGRYEAGGKM